MAHKGIEWIVVDPDDPTQDTTGMPDDVKYTCPFCGAGIGQWCMTRAGNWAEQSHKARPKEVA